MVVGFIIFGWPKRTKEFGPALYYQCPACEKPAHHHYTRARRWFSLFFLPFLPLWTADFYATCNNCGFTEEIESKEDAKRYKQAVGLTEEYLNNTLPVTEYYPQIEDLMRDVEMIEIPKNEPPDRE